jgi:hypothetical protein
MEIMLLIMWLEEKSMFLRTYTDRTPCMCFIFISRLTDPYFKDAVQLMNLRNVEYGRGG